MYAHVNVWMMNDAGAVWDDSAAREIGAALREQPGFRAYTLVRSGEWQVIAVTVFESQEALDAALAAIAPLVRARVRPLASDAPARYQGAVLHHVTGGPAPQSPSTWGPATGGPQTPSPLAA